MKSRFPKVTVTAIRDAKSSVFAPALEPHRIIGIWAVVIEGRVFCPVITLKPRSWYRTLREERRGVIEVEGRQIKMRAVFTRSERLKAAVDRAYAENTTLRLAYLRRKGFRLGKRRDTTTELVPG